jgi:hypothetical protein
VPDPQSETTKAFIMAKIAWFRGGRRHIPQQHKCETAIDHSAACLQFKNRVSEQMRLKFIIPTAGCTCLTAVTAEGSAPPRDERNRNLRRNRKHRNASRKKTRELDAFDDDQVQLDLFNMGVATPSLYAPTMRPTTKSVAATQPSFRLKIYWQSGYYWQGDDDDPIYCMGTFFLRSFVNAKLFK